MRAVLTITAKDLRLRLRDRSVFLFGVVAPLVLAVVLGGVFGGLDERIQVRLGLVVPDAGTSAAASLGARFVTDVAPALQADGLLEEVVRHDDEAAARRAVEEGAVDVALVYRGDDAEVIGHADRPTAAAIATSVARQLAESAAVTQRAVAVASSDGAVVDPAVLVAALESSRRRWTLQDVSTGLAPLDVATYMSAGMAVFFLLFATGIAVTGQLEEARDGTLARLLAAPVPGWAPSAAKALGAYVVGVVSMLVLVVGTSVLVDASWGAPLGVVVLVLAAVLAATGVVSLVASGVRNAEQAGSVQAIVGTVMGALGGVFFPIEGGLLGVISRFTPHRWFLDGLTAVAGGGTTADVARPVAVLLAMGVLALGVAAVRDRRGREV